MGFMLLILSWLIKILLAAYIISRYLFTDVEDPPEASAPNPQHGRSPPPTLSPIRRLQALQFPRPILPYPLGPPPSPASFASDHGDEMPDYGTEISEFRDRVSGPQEQPFQLPNAHSFGDLTGVSEESDQDTYGLRQREPSRARIRSIEEISSTTRELVEPAEAAKNSEGSRSCGGELMGQPRSQRIRQMEYAAVRAIIEEESKNLGEKKSSSGGDSNCTIYTTASTSTRSLEETYYVTGE